MGDSSAVVNSYYLLFIGCLILTVVPRITVRGKSDCPRHQNYTVAASGSDTPGCTSNQSKVSCKSLEYLLSRVHRCANITILDKNISLSSSLKFNSSTDMIIAGSVTSHVNVSCSNGSGLVFVNSQRVQLRGLRFISCSVRCPHDNAGIYPLVDYAAVCAYQGSDVIITGCGFLNGSGTGVIMHDVTGNNQLVDSSFTRGIGHNNISNTTSGGVIIKRQHVHGAATYTIDSCHFADNHNQQNYGTNSDPNGMGGGLHFHFGSNNSVSSVHLNWVRFLRNDAIQGGGMQVNQSGYDSLLTVSVNNSLFKDNHALEEGGGMWVRQVNSPCICRLEILNTIFNMNSGEWGGGLGVYSGNSYGNISMTVKNSNWTLNTADSGGYAVATYYEAVGTELPDNETTYYLLANFTSCNFTANLVKGHVDPNSLGAVYVGGSMALFVDCNFLSNAETALFVRQFGFVEFAGNTNFSDNHGFRGGAIYVDYMSAIGLRGGVELYFERNYAVIIGGAIYTEPVDPDLYQPPNHDICVFMHLRTLSESLGNYKVFFLNNTAAGHNQSVYVGSARGCVNRPGDGSVLLFNDTFFTFEPWLNTQIASVPHNVALSCLSCSNNGDHLEVMLGQRFYLVPNVTDRFNNPAYLFGYLELLYNDSRNVTTPWHLELIGPTMISMDNFTANSDLYLSGSSAYINAESDFLRIAFMYPKPSEQYSMDYRILSVRITDCKVGYAYNHFIGICECVNSVSVSCDPDFTYACVRYGYWLGRHDTTDGVTYPCPAQNCYYTDGNCPRNGPCSDSLQEFCILSHDPDDLCWPGRGGIMCASCRQNHSFTFGALRCVNSSTCSRPHTAIIICSIFIYWIANIIFVLVILNIKLRTGLGFLYGVVYYFSIIHVFTNKTMTDSTLLKIINTCIAVTQLCPRAFGDINICFVEGWNLNIQHQLFQYATPVCVIVIIVLIILLSGYGPRWPKVISLAENSPIHAICTLILLSYTAITYTNFEILKLVKIKGEARVYADPHLKYFGSEHIPYTIIALLFECFISLPICLLLLLAPLLVRKVNLVRLRLQPIVDDLQACYRPQCRWFAGFYFLARQVVYLANNIPSSSFPHDKALQLANAVILVVHITFQPYKHQWLNVLDTLLLVDLVFLSFFNLGWSSNWMDKSVPYLLILPPALYLFLAIFLIMGKRVFRFLWSVKAVRTRLRVFQSRVFARKESKQEAADFPSSRPTSSTIGLGKDHSYASNYTNSMEDPGEREPLLADSYYTDQSSFSDPKIEPRVSRSRDSMLRRFPPQATAKKAATT